MATRNVVLTEQQHAFVESLVKSGRYQNASEVLREGLRMVQRREAEDAARLDALRRAVDQGWSDLESGRFTDVGEGELGAFLSALSGRAAAQVRTPEG